MKRKAALPRWLRHALRVGLQLVLDAAAVALAYRLAYAWRFHGGWLLSRVPVQGVDPGWGLYAKVLYSLVPLWLGIFWYSCQLYTRPWLGWADRFLLIVKGAVLGSLATLAATFIYSRMEYSRLMLLLAAPLAVFLVSAAELAVFWLDSWVSTFEATSPLVLIGGGRVAELIRENLRARHPRMVIHELDKATAPEEALRKAQGWGASEIVLARAAAGDQKALALAEACESADIAFKMIPDLLELRLGEVQMDDSLGLPAYRVQHASLTRANFAAKRVFDVVFSSAVMALTAVPFAAVALLIALDSKGPVLYKQKRLGYKGRIFEALKFRTMVADAEANIEAAKALAGKRDGFFKLKDDPRVTRVGKWLRRFSLDEFPQFLNVFLGDMSVVGPRPLAVATGELEELVRDFGPTARKRMNILPGITGLWQVSGRSDVSPDQRFALDMFYIEHWSLGLDLQIILKTVPAMLAAKGAY